MKEIWPQLLVIVILVLLLGKAIMLHFKLDEWNTKRPTLSQTIWTVVTLAAILGAGGFWKPLGW